MSKTINISDLKGQRGQIYVARKGTSTIICLDDGRNYRIEPRGNTATPVVDAYWAGSINWLGGFSEHWTWGIPQTRLPQKHAAQPLAPVTPAMWEKLEALCK